MKRLLPIALATAAASCWASASLAGTSTALAWALAVSNLSSMSCAGAAVPQPWAAQGAAQDDAGDRVNTVIVYGDDECQQSSAEELVICVRMNEEERYRIPEPLRQSNDPANEAWANRVQSFEAIGDFGPLSCSPVGAGGELGCLTKIIEAAYAEKRGGPSAFCPAASSRS